MRLAYRAMTTLESIYCIQSWTDDWWKRSQERSTRIQRSDLEKRRLKTTSQTTRNPSPRSNQPTASPNTAFPTAQPCTKTPDASSARSRPNTLRRLGPKISLTTTPPNTSFSLMQAQCWTPKRHFSQALQKMQPRILSCLQEMVLPFKSSSSSPVQ